MSDKLKDPSKAAQAIIEVLEDGDAIRNDGVRLTAANKNPWYVLATIYGEQEEGADLWDYDEELAAKNRRAWNGWFCGGLSDEDRADRAKKAGVEPKELAPLNEAELAEIRKRFAARMGKGAKLPPNDQDIDFSNTIFSKPFCADNMVLNRDVDFLGVVFNRSASFYSALFVGYVNFESVIFDGDATFSSAIFTGTSNFCFAIFMGDVAFNTTTFTGSSAFASGVFNSFADFISAMFVNEVDFSSTTFMDSVVLSYATFTGDADFSFAKFKSTTRFTEARFLTHVPQFYAAVLYDETVFSCRDQDKRKWPPLQKHITVDGVKRKVMGIADQKRAYNRLRLFMNKSLQLEDEQFFHRQEMRCKTRLASWYHKPLYWFYGGLSDFGNSVVRPIVGIIAVICLGALFMLWWQGAFAFTPQEAGVDWTFGLMGKEDSLAEARNAVGWSVSNTLPFLGFGRLYYGGEIAAGLDWPLRVVGGVQTLLGYILLFLMGLGLRNRFRLR